MMRSGILSRRGTREAVAAAALVSSVAGSAFGPSKASAAGGPGCHSEWPVVVHRAGGTVVNLPDGAELPLVCATETGYASSESTIAVSGNGTLVYSPAETENSMVRSTDGGATWSLTYPAFEQHTAFWNTVDPFLIADRRTGRLFWAHATGPVRDEGSLPNGSGFLLAAAYGFQVYTSADDGRTWTTADYSTAPTGDWEQVFTGPPPAGAVQPVGYPDVVYLCANSPLEVSGPGRLCYKSLDGGATFEIAGYVSPSATNPPDICPPLQFNNGVVDGAGTIYIPATCQFSAYVAISRDEGATYTWVAVPDAPPSASIVEGGYLHLAIDDADTLYAMWASPEDGLLYLERSIDGAASWTEPLMVAAPGVVDVQRPAFSAGAPGHVGFTYYASTEPAADRLSAYVTETRNATDADPLFYSGTINDPDEPIFHDYGLIGCSPRTFTGCSPRTDFVGGAYDSAGTSFWAGVVKQHGTPSASGDIATTGYVGRLVFGDATPAQVGP